MTVVSPVWPESPDAPIEEFEKAFINIIPAAGRMIILAHSYGSCVVERCISKGMIEIERIEYIEHFSPLFRLNRTGKLLIKCLPGWIPFRFKKSLFTDELWYNSYHPKRGIRIRHLVHLVDATEGLPALVVNVPRTIHLVRYDPLVDSKEQERFVNCDVTYSESKTNKHRSAWESI